MGGPSPSIAQQSASLSDAVGKTDAPEDTTGSPMSRGIPIAFVLRKGRAVIREQPPRWAKTRVVLPKLTDLPLFAGSKLSSQRIGIYPPQPRRYDTGEIA
jgi:hypothetical protein